MITGAVVGAGGIVTTRFVMTATPSFGTLSAVLTIAGLGFGIAVVPLTSAVLGNVPAALSGMAASATNTSRQIGAVVGVAALGALVNSHLTSDLTDRLARIGVTGSAKDLIIQAVESGGGGPNSTFDIAHPPALFASAALMLLAAVFTALIPRTGDEG